MQKVPMELVRPGMVLARTVTNDAGMALCGEGTELTDTIIERLRRMNVSHLTLKGHPVDMGDTKTAQQKIEELQARFVRVRNDPLMEKILAASEKAVTMLDDERKAQEAAEGEGS